MKYLLAIERNHNNYLPIDWNLLPNYNGAQIDNLSGIDSYTKNMTESELKRLLLDANMISEAESEKKIIILFFSEGFRKLSYGACFADTQDYLNTEFVLNTLRDNFLNKIFMNRIYNAFNKITDKTPAFKDLINAKELSELNNIYYIDYLELRSLGMFISTLLVVKKEAKADDKGVCNSNYVPESIKKELIKDVA